MKFIDAYKEHGVTFINVTEDQAHGVCCFCSRDKFFVNPTTGLWDCKTCMVKGNLPQFLEKRMPYYQSHFKGQVVFALSSSRNVKPATLVAWGIGYDPATRQYMIPQRIPNFRNIARYQIGKKMYSTSGARPGLFAPLKLRNTQTVYINEGPWDAAALSECTQDDCYATAGVGNFTREASEHFIGKDIIVIGDKDAINPVTGKSPGNSGVAKTGAMLSGTAGSLQYLHWPSNIPADGYGIRQLLRDLKDHKKVFSFVRDNLKPDPPVDDTAASSTTMPAYSGNELNRADVLVEYRKWLYLSNPEVLDVLYGAAFANQINIDPLWLFIVGPPGSCKTELLQSISEAKRMEGATTMTPQALVSGSNNTTADPSLIPKLNGKTLIIKDFTTILTMNPQARDEIFGILRDAYDGKIEKWFGNGAHRLYHSKFGILAAVTSKIEELASTNSALGERFIKYRFKAPGKVDVGREAIKASLQGVLTGSPMRTALKEIGKKVLARSIKPTEIPTPDAATAERLLLLAQFVACLRGVVTRDKYSGNVLTKPQAEVGTRLSKQFCALAMGISVYKRDATITRETMDTIVTVGKDTAPDRVEEIIRQLYILSTHDKDSAFTVNEIAERTRLPAGTISYMLQDMNMLHLVKHERGERISKWRLDQGVRNIIEKVGLYKRERSLKFK